MQLFVRAQSTHLVDVNSTTTVADVKEVIFRSEGIACVDQVVCQAGVPLEDSFVLGNCQNLASVDVSARVVGGKVHGSLSRAGKVKAQTPKVEAEEKKKKLTGRAKRRKQYNQRFVTTVAGFGKKKGPNSNSA
ncbi:hypothetical protein SARC_05259 [Sphaeroforma arctica JP610]|uniref:Ubiquitin-like domain-containing protein n=1 Tax=Sphaeroforma arctica JP610 TaxID=667725 RepID=A0A0L0G024_9EUKA|nr:hypothetical protein SARC_05259 [Sphaeroforma arctica JP610]KNC82467.1 hypothetical protein SARC_05259 [Sphaeroforma arctica JP610]|eukprot:XP_014156369.1 hypothetical protein SARC_05259 [Sphaeroforma arctica JP610]